jgi:hypothetical protein
MKAHGSNDVWADIAAFEDISNMVLGREFGGEIKLVLNDEYWWHER